MERTKTLYSYREDVDTIIYTIEPSNSEYSEVLTKLFNNKREEKDILELRNYYGSNKITVVINFTDYCDTYSSRDEQKEHLKNWINSFMVDNDINNIEVREGKASIYYIDEYTSKVETEVDGQYADIYYKAEL